MSEVDCPECGATLRELSSDAQCPFCHTELADRYRPAATPQSAVAPGRRGMHSSIGFDSQTLPDGSLIRVAQATPTQVVLELLPGGPRARGLLWMSVFWNIITLGIGAVFIAAGAGGAGGAGFVPFILLGIFLLIGMVMGYFGVRMRFTHTYLMLAPDRFALQKVLLGRKDTTQFSLDRNSHAVLTESYQENDEPVYRVDVKGVEKTEGFGTALSYDDKRWLVDQINGFLTGDNTQPSREETDPKSAALKVTGGLIDSLRIDQLSSDSPVRVEDTSDGDRLIEWPVLPSGRLRTAVTFILGLFSAGFGLFALVGVGFIVSAAFREGEWLALLIAVPFCILGVVPFLLFRTVRNAMACIRMSPDNMQMGLRAGFFRWNRSKPLQDLQAVILADPERSSGVTVTSYRGGTTSVREIPPGCVLRFSGESTPVPLTPGHPEIVALEVGGIIRHYAERHGVIMQDKNTGHAG